MAVTAPGVDVRAVVQRQRTATLRALQEYTRLKRRTSDADLAWSLVLDSLVFAAEAEVRWLDHCETRLSRAAYGSRLSLPDASVTGQPARDRNEGVRP